MRRFAVIVFAGLVAAIVASAPGTSSARLDLCEAGLGKEAQKYRKAVIQRIEKCVDFIRKERDFQGPKGKDNIPKAAALCQKQLVKATDLTGSSGGKDAFSKLLSGLDKLRPTKCEDDDLDKLGQFTAGVNAPPFGGSPDEIDWMKYKIAVSEVYYSWVSTLIAYPRADELIQELLADPVDPKDTDSFVPVDCTDSGGTTTVTDHADLCAWHKNNATQRNGYWAGTGTLRNMCFMHTCVLDCNPGNPPAATFSTIRLATPGSEGTNGTNVIFPPVCGTSTTVGCGTNGTPRFEDLLGPDDKDYRGSWGGQSNAAHSIRLDANRQVCVRGLMSDGWTDCNPGGAGNPGPVITMCIDHHVAYCDGEFCQNCEGVDCTTGVTECSNDQDCGEDDCATPSNQPANDENCYCSSSPTPCGGLNEDDCVPILTKPCTLPDDSECGVGELCIARESGGKCHVTSYNSRAKTTYGGSSVHGDSILFGASSLTITNDTGTAGICIGGADEGEECDALSDCSGGTECQPMIGPDLEPCTADDITSRASTGYSISTSGSNIAIVEDAMYVEGSCSGSGRPCYNAENCDGLETCDGAGFGRVEQPVLLTASPGPRWIVTSGRRATSRAS
jgi:hypothetical protein